MSKVKIGKLEVVIPEACLGDVEEAAALEEKIKAAAAAEDFDGMVLGYLAVIHVMARAENADLTVDWMRKALPFLPGKRLAAARQAYLDTLVAAGVTTETSGGVPGEAQSP